MCMTVCVYVFIHVCTGAWRGCGRCSLDLCPTILFEMVSVSRPGVYQLGYIGLWVSSRDLPALASPVLGIRFWCWHVWPLWGLGIGTQVLLFIYQAPHRLSHIPRPGCLLLMCACFCFFFFPVLRIFKPFFFLGVFSTRYTSRKIQKNIHHNMNCIFGGNVGWFFCVCLCVC